MWVDRTFCGGEDTLSAPQILDVTAAMTPGKHTITVVIDNAKLPPVGPAHAVDELAGVPAPVVGHETGQFQVYPDFRELPLYTGVLKARNMEVFRERLKAAGMLDQAHDFVRASGALSAICYREDIEAALLHNITAV